MRTNWTRIGASQEAHPSPRSRRRNLTVRKPYKINMEVHDHVSGATPMAHDHLHETGTLFWEPRHREVLEYTTLCFDTQAVSDLSR